MKVTLEIADALLARAQRQAARDSVTLDDLVEAGLLKILAQSRSAVPFRLRDARVHGNGLSPEFRGAEWDRVRDAIDANEPKA